MSSNRKKQHGKEVAKEQRNKRLPQHKPAPNQNASNKSQKTNEPSEINTKDASKNLKTDTDILIITEPENQKYQKKEITSNWSKYEVPLESPDSVAEEHLGADYEQLLQGALSIGSHFQFKHEKSWHVSTEPTLYDKYFEPDYENLHLAIETVPFYERNGIDIAIFSESDIVAMNKRAQYAKNKYYKLKDYLSDTVLKKQQLLSSPDDHEEQMIGKLKDHLTESKLSSNDIRQKMCVDAEKGGRDTVSIESQSECKENVKHTHESLVDEVLKSAAITSAASEINTGGQESSAKKTSITESPEDLEKWLDTFLDS